jgi:hypothetical protein
VNSDALGNLRSFTNCVTERQAAPPRPKKPRSYPAWAVVVVAMPPKGKGVADSAGRKKWDVDDYEKKIRSGKIQTEYRRPVGQSPSALPDHFPAFFFIEKGLFFFFF